MTCIACLRRLYRKWFIKITFIDHTKHNISSEHNSLSRLFPKHVIRHLSAAADDCERETEPMQLID